MLSLAIQGEILASQWGKTGGADSTAPLNEKVLFFFSGENEEYRKNYPHSYEHGEYIKVQLDIEPTGSGIAQYHFSGIDGQWTDKYAEYYAYRYSLEDVIWMDKEALLSHIHVLLEHEDFLEDFIHNKAEPWMCDIPIGDMYQLVRLL